MGKNNKKVFESLLYLLSPAEINLFINFLYPQIRSDFEYILKNKEIMFEILEKVIKSIMAKGKVVIIADDFDLMDAASYDFILHLIENDFLSEGLKLLVAYKDKKLVQSYFYLNDVDEAIYDTIFLDKLSREQLETFIGNFVNGDISVIPDDIIDQNLEIDILVDFLLVNDEYEDIGSYSPYYNEQGVPYDPETNQTKKYGPEDLSSLEMARYFSAASEFNKIVPNVKINIHSNLPRYKSAHKHLPHLIYVSDNADSRLLDGYATDVSQYSNTTYYKAYNEFLLTRYNYGGFQSAFPTYIEPWGIFVNTNDLVKYNIVNDVHQDGVNSNEYKNWVDNFTWESFIDAVKKASNDTHAGLSKVVEYFTSYSLSTIYNQYVTTGSVDFTSSKANAALTKLLTWENELVSDSKNTIYLYDDFSFGNMLDTNRFPNATSWNANKNFYEDQYCTFFADSPWILSSISQSINTAGLSDEIAVDFLPYPMIDETSNQYSGVALGGLSVGNQTPLDYLGTTTYDGYSSLEEALKYQEVAAYFAMFIGVDPRVVKANSESKFKLYETEYSGSATLPLTKKGFKYPAQKDASSDPAKDYEDNWQYQMAQWLYINDAFVTNDLSADVLDFSNVTYGLVKVLDTIYGNNVTSISYWTSLVKYYEAGGYDDIFTKWTGRFFNYADKSTYKGKLGSAEYVATVLNNLSATEQHINEYAKKARRNLQNKLDQHYGKGKYDVSDMNYRNNYQGSIIK